MMRISEALQSGANARTLAQAALAEHFAGKQVIYPIDPFQMLTEYNVPFVFRDFSSKKCEGIYLPAQGKTDIAVVGINIKRPIQRQRYTAAHELCHHIKDRDSTQVCDITSVSPVEKYAEAFAAELLMPYQEMKKQIQSRAPTGYLSFDDILDIAEYFGVSFRSCLQRAAWVYKKVEGDTSPAALKKRAEKYHAEKQREARGYVSTPLYEQLIDADEQWLRMVAPTEFIKAKYCTSYIYNDSRLEGIDLESNRVAEVVTDIRLYGGKSRYCTQAHEKEVQIAGHAQMYEFMFSMPENAPIDLFTIVPLHKALYSCAPAPEFGGMFRRNNTLVMGAKFETTDHQDVIPKLLELAPEVKELLEHGKEMPLSAYIEKAAEIHHRLTVIHPFGDGNGRTTRCFLSLLLMRRGACPIYIRVEEKEEYRAALSKADTTGDHHDLYTVIFKAIMRAQAELTEAPPI